MGKRRKRETTKPDEPPTRETRAHFDRESRDASDDDDETGTRTRAELTRDVRSRRRVARAERSDAAVVARRSRDATRRRRKMRAGYVA